MLFAVCVLIAGCGSLISVYWLAFIVYDLLCLSCFRCVLLNDCCLLFVVVCSLATCCLLVVVGFVFFVECCLMCDVCVCLPGVDCCLLFVVVCWRLPVVCRCLL